MGSVLGVLLRTLPYMSFLSLVFLLTGRGASLLLSAGSLWLLPDAFFVSEAFCCCRAFEPLFFIRIA
jgi:hypothetical protein